MPPKTDKNEKLDQKGSTRSSRDRSKSCVDTESESEKKNSGKKEAIQVTLDQMVVSGKIKEKETDVLETKLDRLTTTIEAQFKKMLTIDNLDKQMKSLKKEMSEHIDEKLEDIEKNLHKKLSKEIEERVAGVEMEIKTEIDNIKEEQQRLREQNIELKEKLEEKDYVIKTQSWNINELEQYSRRNSVRIYGVDDMVEKESALETTRKVITLVKEKLDITDISTKDIDMCHRVGQFRSDGNRIILCKFVSRFDKQKVLRVRKKLKGKNVVIREDLTLKNARLLEQMSEREEVAAAWSDEGRIIVLLQSGRKRHIDFKTNLSQRLETKETSARGIRERREVKDSGARDRLVSNTETGVISSTASVTPGTEEGS